MKVLVPPPQLFEQSCSIDQLDHWQSTGGLRVVVVVVVVVVIVVVVVAAAGFPACALLMVILTGFSDGNSSKKSSFKKSNIDSPSSFTIIVFVTVISGLGLRDFLVGME